MAASSSRTRVRTGFTLVELLVVIGIIAVLIGLLMPVITAARRQSVSAKCLSNLRSIGQALNAYALDNKGYWPVVQHYNNTVTPPFDVRWNMMLLRYLTSPSDADNFTISQGPAGNASQLVVNSGPGFAEYKDTAMFCPESAEYKDNVGPTVSPVQTGYGMQKMPLNSLTFPAAGTTNSVYAGLENGKYWALIRPAPNRQGRYYKASDWGRNGSDRIIIADARSYDLDVEPVPATDDRGRQSVGFSGDQANNDNQADRFRHSIRYVDTAVTPNRLNGKVAFNALYCDGHAATLTTIEQLFLGVRMRLTP